MLLLMPRRMCSYASGFLSKQFSTKPRIANVSLNGRVRTSGGSRSCRGTSMVGELLQNGIRCLQRLFVHFVFIKSLPKGVNQRARFHTCKMIERTTTDLKSE